MGCLIVPWDAFAYTGASPNWTTDGTQADVQAAHDDAGCVDGDTIHIPAGTFSGWVDGNGAPGLNITKHITLKGAGTSSTTITIDDGAGTADHTIRVTTTDPGVFRMQGITFNNGTATKNNVADFFNAQGDGYVVIEDCDFDTLTPSPVIRIAGENRGVMSKCNVTVGASTFIWFFNGIRAGGNGDADEVWTEDVGFGQDNAFFVEHNTFTGTDTGDNYNVTDMYGGARLVIRYNSFDGVHCSSHGTGDGQGRIRGPRYTIMHDNTFKDTLSAGLAQVAHRNRGGPGIYYNETYEDLTGGAIRFSYYRGRSPHGKFQIFPTKGIDQWTTVETGELADTPTAEVVLVDSSQSWTTDEHVDRIMTIDMTDTVDYRSTDVSTISSVDTGTDEITFTAAHSFTADEHVFGLANGGALPTGLAQDVSYFINVIDTDTVTLLSAPGGATVDITGAGSGSPTIEGLGNAANEASFRWDYQVSPILSNTGTVLTGEDGQQSIWLDHKWFLAGNAYEIHTVHLGIDMPGAGICHAIPGSYDWKDGQTGEAVDQVWLEHPFTTNFASDANQVNISLPYGGENVHVIANGERVQVESTGTLPAPLVADTDYWVVNRTTTTIELATVEDGTPITLTSDGSGTHTAVLMLHQEIDGCYVFNMTYGPTQGTSADAGVRENIVWFEENPSYNGTSGMGVGVIASRPASPALLNTGYWATDTETLSAWRDTTGNGSGDTWVDIYQEYAYPHPLRTSTTKIITNSITVN